MLNVTFSLFVDITVLFLSSLFLFCHFCLVFVFMMLPLEPCRCPSDIFLFSRLRNELATADILLGMVEARSINVKNTHTQTQSHVEA